MDLMHKEQGLLLDFVGMHQQRVIGKESPDAYIAKGKKSQIQLKTVWRRCKVK